MRSTAFGAPSDPTDQARWIARHALALVRTLPGGQEEADRFEARVGYMTDGRATAWLAARDDTVPDGEPVPYWEAARELGVAVSTVKTWVAKYPRLLPRIVDGVRLDDARRVQAMSPAQRAAAELAASPLTQRAAAAAPDAAAA